MNISQASVYDYPFYGSKNNAPKPSEILELLRYFGVFKHPLRADELYKFSAAGASVLSEKTVLEKMKATGEVKQYGEYYLLNNAPEMCVEKRINGEKLAGKLLPKAKRTGRFIGMFPFVKFVGISGSLSKNYADENTDFDFFIITANNTLWICRSILHIVKKLSFIIGKQHSLCMNYFIDEHHLKIEEKNIFTRIELSTLIPVYNKDLYRTFLLRNQNNLPNIRHLGVDFEGAVQYNLTKWNRQNLVWKPLNIFLMKFTDARWKRKWKKRGYAMQDYDLAFKTTPYVSKNHPKNYQKKILEQLENQAH
ncbi:hypothetical protein A9P82_03425 [Arachidicoccus ginsenosidimutans]|uniref:hypothetical protein n=1 Tax=Arachidicoccus sp. BS20 TaxID=1850526 RepID=UPI0007F13431|nr:hypothetical protein [Arachidicoccus sp. BS20]ANI88436.1 hypothetical protein A9P82_03425 [Arachidicoccus sp. BS20]